MIHILNHKNSLRFTYWTKSRLFIDFECLPFPIIRSCHEHLKLAKIPRNFLERPVLR